MYLSRTLSALVGVMAAVQSCTGESLTESDIKIIRTDGVTEGKIEGNIILQNTSTVTFELKQYWDAPVEKIFYEYYHNPFSTKCSESTGAEPGEVIEKITAHCTTTTPTSFVHICIQDSTGNVLVPDDKATIPKCCHSDAAENTPTVCYRVAIDCEAESMPTETTSAPESLVSSTSAPESLVSSTSVPETVFSSTSVPETHIEPRTLRNLTYNLPRIPNDRKFFSYGLCVMNARGVEVKTSIDKMNHTNQGTFQDGMTTMWTGNWNRKPFYPININGLGDEYCEGGEYIAPNYINTPFKNIDLEITAEPLFKDFITVCAMVCTQAEGGWPDPLTDAGYTVSEVWRIQQTGTRKPSKYTYRTFCKDVSVDEANAVKYAE